FYIQRWFAPAEGALSRTCREYVRVGSMAASMRPTALERAPSAGTLTAVVAAVKGPEKTHPSLCLGTGGFRSHNPSKLRFHIPQRDVHAFQLRVMVDRGGAVFAADTGLLVAAHGHLHRAQVVVVDPADAGLQFGDHAVRACDVAGE